MRLFLEPSAVADGSVPPERGPTSITERGLMLATFRPPMHESWPVCESVLIGSSGGIFGPATARTTGRAVFSHLAVERGDPYPVARSDGIRKP
jgi:hypothetical protein